LGYQQDEPPIRLHAFTPQTLIQIIGDLELFTIFHKYSTEAIHWQIKHCEKYWISKPLSEIWWTEDKRLVATRLEVIVDDNWCEVCKKLLGGWKCLNRPQNVAFRPSSLSVDSGF
jgi:hypothetical protein